MALQLTHIVKGITLTNAYHKVEYISGNKSSIHVDVCISATNSDEKIDGFSFKLEDPNLFHDDGSSDKNYTKQAYEYLKSGPITDLSGGTRDLSSGTDV